MLSRFGWIGTKRMVRVAGMAVKFGVHGTRTNPLRGRSADERGYLFLSMGTTRRMNADDHRVGVDLVFARAEINAANVTQRGRSRESPRRFAAGH